MFAGIVGLDAGSVPSTDRPPAGPEADCLRIQAGRTIEGMTSLRTGVGDVAATRLSDGRIRIYGGRMVDPGAIRASIPGIYSMSRSF